MQPHSRAGMASAVSPKRSPGRSAAEGCPVSEARLLFQGMLPVLVQTAITGYSSWVCSKVRVASAGMRRGFSLASARSSPRLQRAD